MERVAILFLCKGEFRYFFPQLARMLREQHGLLPSAIAFNTPSTEMLEHTRLFDRVYNLAAHIKRWDKANTAEIALQRLEEYEATPGAINVNLMVAGDRIISRYPSVRTLKLMAAILQFWQELFFDAPPDVILGEVSCGAEWMCWSLAQQEGIPYLIPYPPSVAGRLFFIHSPAGMWQRMAERFETSRSQPLSAEQIAHAEAFLREFRLGRTRAAYFNVTKSNPLSLWHPRQLQARLERAPFRLRAWWHDGYSEVASYHGTPPWKPVLHDMLRPLRHFAAELRLLRKDVPSGKKLFYALHMQPEFTTNIRDPFHENQIAVIENISRSMPVGYRLIVKEHPAMKGDRALSYYRQLKAISNVDLLSSTLNSHELIRQSDAVLTITGSVAWEAILMGKPVIAFGPLCYDFYDHLFHCGDLRELPSLLMRVLRSFNPDHGTILRMVHALLESAYEGEWNIPLTVPRAGSRDNYQKVAYAIAKEVELVRYDHRQSA
jgi:Capsule polysaccharide biosynthesis protein